MAKIRFYLKTPKTPESVIFARISTGEFILTNGEKKYNQIKYYISESINPTYWNKKTNRAKETKLFPQHPEFNKRLDDIESTIKKTLLELKNRGQISNESVKEELDKVFKPHLLNPTTETPKELFSFIEYFLKTSALRPTSVKSYRTVQLSLLEFQKSQKRKLTFENMDIDFYDSFTSYMRKQSYAVNTIGTRIKVIKTILSNAEDRGIKVCQDYKKKAFKKTSEEVDHIYLNETELDKLYKIEKTTNFQKRLKEHNHQGDQLPIYLKRVKDLFLIGCYTGLRYSDISHLQKNDFSGDGFLHLRTQKTNQDIVIPIHPIVRAIFESYDYKLPKTPSNQKYNEYLKEIGYLAGLTDKVTTEITKGGFVVRNSIEKYKLITSHTARRSFATNAFLADMPSISIMAITGHRTESSFMKYIKMSAEDNARKMQLHPFFNKLTVNQ